ncbi:MAG: hypothetical protein R2873_23250 [Caldilineaceae bacterium]
MADCSRRLLRGTTAGTAVGEFFGITSLAFAPDGRLFIGLDSPSTGEIDPNILFDAFHPSRSVVVYNTASSDQFYTPILEESPRVTGLVYPGGAVYLSRR